MRSRKMSRSRRSRRHCSLDSDRGRASPLRKRCWLRCGKHLAATQSADNRMLKKSASGVLTSLRGSTLRRSFSEVESTLGDFPFAKIHYPVPGRTATQSAVRTASPPRPLRPCLGEGASLGEEAVLADSGWVGEIPARVGRVRSLAILSILKRVTHR